ncbi:hypothetical protein [Corynebacterium epidermidicanis]|uniref:Lipoprotein n=1 Tax=Corynebacterium epidermidicanis TaxID=1050174 RepID=A0A0G3GNN5_9CORY|nr:hypothetical protein [Corynebacterium epidermidicanis]AKK02841.1 hypothetical protein CEPID_04855 [Corynebacterium epidermidicanis]
MNNKLALVALASCAALTLSSCSVLPALPIPGKSKDADTTTASATASSASSTTSSKVSSTRTTSPKSSKSSTSKETSSKETTSKEPTSGSRNAFKDPEAEAKMKEALVALLRPDLDDPMKATASGTVYFDKDQKFERISNYTVNGVKKEPQPEALAEVKEILAGLNIPEKERFRTLKFDYKNGYVEAQYL